MLVCALYMYIYVGIPRVAPSNEYSYVTPFKEILWYYLNSRDLFPSSGVPSGIVL